MTLQTLVDDHVGRNYAMERLVVIISMPNKANITGPTISTAVQNGKGLINFSRGWE